MSVIGYTPQFTQKEYIPTTDVGLLSELIGRKEQQFDQSVGMQNKAVSDLYNLPTTPGMEQTRNSVIEDLQKEFETAINRKGGDPGAAVQDITRIVSQARKDPFFQANKIATEQSQILTEQLARNPNLIVLNDPRRKQWQPGMTTDELQAKVIDPEEVQKKVAQIYSSLGEKSFRGISADPSGKYDIAVYSQGPDEDKIQEILSDPKASEQLKQYFPQIESLSKEQAEPIMRGLLEQGLRSMQKPLFTDVIGKSEDYLNRDKDKRTSKIPNIGFSTYSEKSGVTNVQKEIKDKTDLLRKGLTEDNKFDASLLKTETKEDESTKEINKSRASYYGAPAETDRSRAYSQILNKEENKNKEKNIQKTQEKARDLFNKAKKEYSVLYNQIKSNKGTDKDFIDTLEKIELDSTVKMHTKVGLNASEGFSNLFGKLKESDKPAFTDENGKELSRVEFIKKAKDSGLTETEIKNRQIFLDAKGNMTVELDTGKGVKTYKINSEALPEELKPNKEKESFVRNALTNFQLSKSQLDVISGTAIEVGGNLLEVWIDPNNIFNREIRVIDEDGYYATNSETGKILKLLPADIHKLNALEHLTELSKENK